MSIAVAPSIVRTWLRSPPRAASVATWRCRSAVVGLLVGVALLRIAYLASWCQFDLSPDEAHYWEWSRRLDWSYYSKGPLVAWIIRLSCELFGGMSQAIVGSPMLAVRLPAVVFGSLTLGSVYVLSSRIFRSEAWALLTVGMALTWPILNVGSLLMTIDAPFMCCWGWTLVSVHAAVFDRKRWAWPVAGGLVALGFLAKYTMVLWIPSFALFLAFTPRYRPLLWSRGFMTMCLVAAFGALPVILWNMQNGWITILHAGSHAGAGRSAGHIHWMGPLAYVGGQFGILIGMWFYAWAFSMIVHRPTVERRSDLRYLWFLSVPTFAFFGLFSLKNGGGEANWPLAAYLSGMVLAAWWMKNEWEKPRPVYVNFAKGTTAVFCVLGLLLTFAIYNAQSVRPFLAMFAPAPTAEQTMPMRRVDPTCRLEGWRTLAAATAELRAGLRSEGVEPVLAGDNWFVPGEVAFFLPDHPTVYTVGPAIGDRESQFSLWRPNPVRDPGAFANRTFILIGIGPSDWTAAFESVELVRVVEHRDREYVLAAWNVWIARGYKGFPPPTHKTVY